MTRRPLYFAPRDSRIQNKTVHVWAVPRVIFFRSSDLCASIFFIGRNSYKNVQLILTTHSIAIILTKHQTSIRTKDSEKWSGTSYTGILRTECYCNRYRAVLSICCCQVIKSSQVKSSQVVELRTRNGHIFFFPLESSNFHASTEY